METMTSQPGSPPAVTLLVGSGCSHCLGVLDAFGRLLKEGRVGRLEVINVTLHPDEGDLGVAVRTAEVAVAPPVSIEGPALVARGPEVLELDGATAWIPDGWAGATDPHGTLILRRSQ